MTSSTGSRTFSPVARKPPRGASGSAAACLGIASDAAPTSIAAAACSSCRLLPDFKRVSPVPMLSSFLLLLLPLKRPAPVQ